jgi:hypothetical protein
VVAKVLSRILLTRLSKAVDEKLRELRFIFNSSSALLISGVTSGGGLLSSSLKCSARLSSCSSVVVRTFPKVLSRILLTRLSKAVDEKLREQKSGFITDRSCTDQITALQIILLLS